MKAELITKFLPYMNVILYQTTCISWLRDCK